MSNHLVLVIECVENQVTNECKLMHLVFATN